MAFSTIEGTRLHYETHGCGKPLLFIHGWNGDMGSFKHNMVPRLRNNYLIVLVDLPGFGKSEKTVLSFDRIAHICHRLMETLGFDEYSVMGFCMGGAFALEMAIRYPREVRQVFLVDVTINYPIVLMLPLLPVYGKKMLGFLLKSNDGRRLVKTFVLRQQTRYPLSFLLALIKVDVGISHEYLKLVKKHSKINHYKRIREHVTAKVTAVTGELTSSCIKRSSRKICEAAILAERVEIKKSRHFLIEEQPQELAHVILR